MSINLLTFEEALENSNRYSKRHLLLGNGFSMACKPDIFSYASLFNTAKEEMSDELAQLFTQMDTEDFEIVILALQRAANILEVYQPKMTSIKRRLVADANQLKETLVSAVAQNHPERPNDLSDEQFYACRLFLSNFVGRGLQGKVYTMNYDLLLYWSLMHEEDEALYDPIELNHDDGFRKDEDDYDAEYVEWQGERAANQRQNIHYLHGALHLFDAGHQLQKYTWINTGKPLIEQANEALERNHFPVFVAEGNSINKLTKIQHSAYLHHNFKSFAGICQSLSNAGKCLFIYGHSFAKNDAHILEKIGKGKIDHIFVSLYGDPNSGTNREIQNSVAEIANLRPERFPPLSVDFFDAETALVWG